MNKKILTWSLIIIFTAIFTGFTYATDVIMDLNNSTGNSNSTASNANTSTTNDNVAINPLDNVTSNTVNQDATEPTEDNTIYSSVDQNQTADATDYEQDGPSVSTTDEYEESGDLSISNMINIVLIVVGVVLILLGIAIIIRLKS